MVMGHNARCWIYALVLGFEEIIVVGFQIFCWKELCKFRRFIWIIRVTRGRAVVEAKDILYPVYLGIVCPEPIGS